MTRTNFRIGILAAAMALGLIACGGGGSADTSTTSVTPPPSSSPPSSNSAPTIAGAPGTSVLAGGSYSFTPTAYDADGDTLAFAIQNKPSWATFNTSTGRLSGAPTSGQVGSYLNIVIAVTDGKASATLATFGITVSPAGPNGTAILSWTAPTQNTDGSQLTDLAGYRVYHGTSPNALDQMTQLPGSGNTSYTFNQLVSGTHYFAVAAYTTGGMESSLSGVGSKTIL
jgi:hypothetical protein